MKFVKYLNDPKTFIKKVKSKISLKIFIRRIAYNFEKFSLRFFIDDYKESEEKGAVNIESKLKRVEAGGPFESPITILANKVALQLLYDEKKILEVGSGTGFFAFNSAIKMDVKITASEFNDGALEWAKKNRQLDNISFVKTSLKDFKDNQFDLVVALEVIEHLKDYSGFLNHLKRVAPKAIISTPNKNRNYKDSILNSPEYDEHVREWTAGEFYWILRAFYENVDLYTIKNVQRAQQKLKSDPSFIPEVEKTGILSREHILVARCSN